QGIPVGGFPFSVTGAVLSAVVAVGITLLATLLPALRAGRTPPLAAMSATRVEHAPRPAGIGAWLAAIATLALVVFVAFPLQGDLVLAGKALAVVVLLPLGLYVSQ